MSYEVTGLTTGKQANTYVIDLQGLTEQITGKLGRLFKLAFLFLRRIDYRFKQMLKLSLGHKILLPITFANKKVIKVKTAKDGTT